MRHLIAVREHGSFARAAQVLQISQPSLSASISRLEDQLKVKLFDRSAAGSSITPVGEFIANRATRIVAEVERVTRAAALLSGGNTGSIHLGFGSSLKHILMSRLIVELSTVKPALRLSVHVDATSTLLSLLRAGEIDVAICAVPPQDAVKDLIASEIFTAPLVVAASPSHPLANERSLSVERVLEFPVAGPRIRSVARSAIRLADEQQGVTQYDANDYDALIPLAARGLATLIAPIFVVQRDLESGALVELDLTLPSLAYAAFTNEVNSLSPIVQEIIRRAQDAGKAFAPCSDGASPPDQPSSSIPS